MIGKSSTWVVVLALVAGSNLLANRIGASNSEFRQSYALHPNGSVVIQNLYGDVHIMAWDRDQVLVQAVKKSSDPRRLEDAQIVVDSSYDKLTVRTQYTGSDAEHPASVEYRIMVPRKANLENVKLINGGLSISGLTGPVKASSVNGSIHADRLEGQAELSTINGQLEAAFERLTSEHAISLSSVNGAIHLSIPDGAGACLEANNLSGGIDSQFGRALRGNGGNHLRAVVHHGGAPIKVRNVNGGIQIRGANVRHPSRRLT